MSKEVQSGSERKEDWLNSKWRPMMGWMYMFVCMCDFVIFPILWSLIQAAHGGRVETQWMPITLQGAGLFHMAMGAVLGVTAWSRGQEKLAGVNAPAMNSGYNSSTANTCSTTNDAGPRAAYTGRQGRVGPASQVDPPL